MMNKNGTVRGGGGGGELKIGPSSFFTIYFFFSSLLFSFVHFQLTDESKAEKKSNKK